MLVPRVELELQRLASHYLRSERRDHTLQPTALVHEIYLRLIDQSRVKWRNRAHFVGVAAQLMQRVLVRHARALKAAKRGGGAVQVGLDELSLSEQATDVDILALEEALQRLRQVDAQLFEIVVLQFYGGLSKAEVAEALEISERTAYRRWALARAWLQRELMTGRPGD